MDKFIEGLAAVLQPPWNYIAGVAALILLNLNSFIEFRDRWRSSYAETRQLEQEKLRLEVMLLRKQLRESASQEYVPQIPAGLARDIGAITLDPRASATDVIAPPPPPKPAPAPAPPGSVRRFVMTYPNIGRPLMLLAQAVMAVSMAFMGLGTFGILLIGFTENDPEFGPGSAVILSVIYAGLAWLSYRGYRSASSIRQAT
jgi:hypothetical protein